MLGSSGKQVPEFDKYWQDVKFLLRIRFDDNGIMVGFYSGGESHRGLSKLNLTKLYRHALILGGEDPVNAKKYSYHGGKRGNITFQKSFGGVSDKNVALGSKHAIAGIISEYTDASRCQLSQPAKTQCDIRAKMEAVLAAKTDVVKTPPKKKIPGEVSQKQGYVSPSEVRKMDSILRANNLDTEKLRDIDNFHPGFMRCVLDLVAKSVVGVSYAGTDIQKRAMKYLSHKRNNTVQKAMTGNFENILRANGVDFAKLRNIDKFHPGFMACVLDIAENREAEVSNYSKKIVSRARKYLRNKRREPDYFESDRVFEKVLSDQLQLQISTATFLFHPCQVSQIILSIVPKACRKVVSTR